MKDKIQNLVKNVIEENIVKFKEQTSEVLYSKVGNRLKDEYVNVSKSLFKKINEAVGGMPTQFTTPDQAMMVPPGRGTGGNGPGNNDDPNGPTRGVPPATENPGPPPQKPVKGKDETAEQFEKRLNEYYRVYRAWQNQYEAWKKYRAWQQGLGRRKNKPGYKPSNG